MSASARPGRWRAAFAWLALLPLCAQADTQADAVDALLARLAKHAEQETSFVEVRQSPALTRPVLSGGTLAFEDDGRLVKSTTAPRRERLQVAGGIASVFREGARERRIRLDRVPELAAFLAGLRAALNGDPVALRASFSARIDQDHNGWTLRLEPLDKRVRRRLASLAVRGRDATARCIVTVEGGGAVSTMLLARSLDDVPAEPDAGWIGAQCPGS